MSYQIFYCGNPLTRCCDISVGPKWAREPQANTTTHKASPPAWLKSKPSAKSDLLQSCFIVRCFSYFAYMSGQQWGRHNRQASLVLYHLTPSSLLQSSKQPQSVLNIVSESHVTLPQWTGQLTVGLFLNTCLRCWSFHEPVSPMALTCRLNLFCWCACLLGESILCAVELQPENIINDSTWYAGLCLFLLNTCTVFVCWPLCYNAT